MASFVLRRCKVRDNKFVVVRNEDPLTLSWEDLKTLICVAKTKEELRILGHLRAGIYIGRAAVSPDSPKEKMFAILNPPGSNSFEWLSTKDQTFGSRVRSVFVVEYVRWDGSVVESNTGAA